MASPTSTTNKVPYFVMNLEDGQSRALFTVPSHSADALVVHPIQCRGSSFFLGLSTKDERGGGGNNTTTTTFLATEYYSPHPEETAKEIAERLSIRIGNPSSFVAQMFGVQ